MNYSYDILNFLCQPIVNYIEYLDRNNGKRFHPVRTVNVEISIGSWSTHNNLLIFTQLKAVCVSFLKHTLSQPKQERIIHSYNKQLRITVSQQNGVSYLKMTDGAQNLYLDATETVHLDILLNQAIRLFQETPKLVGVRSTNY